MSVIQYFFDRIQAEGYKKQGVIGARHMPLAVDTDVFEETIRMYNDGNISGDGLGKKLSGSSYDCDVHWLVSFISPITSI